MTSMLIGRLTDGSRPPTEERRRAGVRHRPHPAASDSTARWRDCSAADRASVAGTRGTSSAGAPGPALGPAWLAPRRRQGRWPLVCAALDRVPARRVRAPRRPAAGAAAAWPAGLRHDLAAVGVHGWAEAAAAGGPGRRRPPRPRCRRACRRGRRRDRAAASSSTTATSSSWSRGCTPAGRHRAPVAARRSSAGWPGEPRARDGQPDARGRSCAGNLGITRVGRRAQRAAALDPARARARISSGQRLGMPPGGADRALPRRLPARPRARAARRGDARARARRAHLVFLGYGALARRSTAGGRPARSAAGSTSLRRSPARRAPAPGWRSADVGVMPIQPSTAEPAAVDPEQAVRVPRRRGAGRRRATSPRRARSSSTTRTGRSGRSAIRPSPATSPARSARSWHLAGRGARPTCARAACGPPTSAGTGRPRVGPPRGPVRGTGGGAVDVTMRVLFTTSRYPSFDSPWNGRSSSLIRRPHSCAPGSPSRSPPGKPRPCTVPTRALATRGGARGGWGGVVRRDPNPEHQRDAQGLGAPASEPSGSPSPRRA